MSKTSKTVIHHWEEDGLPFGSPVRHYYGRTADGTDTGAVIRKEFQPISGTVRYEATVNLGGRTMSHTFYVLRSTLLQKTFDKAKRFCRDTIIAYGNR